MKKVYYDPAYTNGVIAVREKTLLKEKLLRFCEMSAEESFRALLESGFGGGAETASGVHEYEKLIAAEEKKIDDFIREYAPTSAEREYLLSPRDFHNAKALIKAAHLGVSADRLLAPEGLLSIDLIKECVQTGDFTKIMAFNAYLGGACKQAQAFLEEQTDGAKVGEIFEKALYACLWATAKKSAPLRALICAKADMTNILTAFRAGDSQRAKDMYLPVGKLTEKQLNLLFLEDEKKIKEGFAATPYAAFVGECLEAKAKGLPMTVAEKIVDGYDAEYFAARRFALEKSEPFLYYVFRRRAENANVRVVFACLLAGQNEAEIKKRLRAI